MPFSEPMKTHFTNANTRHYVSTAKHNILGMRNWCHGMIEMSVNSLSPSAAYMRQWIGSALVQIMACRLFGVKPLSKPMLTYCQLDRKGTYFKEILFKNSNISIQENAFEHVVCEMAATLSTGRWVKIYFFHILAAFIWTSKLTPTYWIKSLQLIWRLSDSIFQLVGPDLQMTSRQLFN